MLGTRHGRACHATLAELVENFLKAHGLTVLKLTLCGGITEHYGRPEAGTHAIQIEINRGIYMDKAAISAMPDLANCPRPESYRASHRNT